MRQPHIQRSTKQLQKKGGGGISMNCFGVTSGTYFLSEEIKLQRDYIVCYILCKKDKPEINENNYL